MNVEQALRSLPIACRTLAILAGAVALVGCGTPTETPVPVRLSLAVDKSALALAGDLAAAYHAAEPQIVVDVEPVGNAQAAAAAVLERRVDLAISTTTPSAAAADALLSQAIAATQMAFIVNPANQLAGIDAAQAAAILRGDLRDWSQVGGESGAIQVVTREADSGPRRLLERSLLDDRALTPMAFVVPGEAEMLDLVGRDRAAIGFVPSNYLNETVKPLTLDGIGPNAAAAMSSGYALMLPIYLLSPEVPSAEVVAFHRFVQSRAGRQAIEKRHVAAGASP